MFLFVHRGADTTLIWGAENCIDVGRLLYELKRLSGWVVAGNCKKYVCEYMM